MAAQDRARRVVVTGVGMITPLGPDTATTFARAAAGESGVAELRAFDATGLPCRIGGQVDDRWLDPAPGGSGRHTPGIVARGARLMLHAARQAASASRLGEVADRERIAVTVGSHGDTPELEQLLLLHRCTDGRGHWDVARLLDSGGYDVLQLYRRKPDIAAALLAASFDCRGPNLSLTSACAAGAQAIGEATRLIREGRADLALTGGCEATLTFTGFVGFVLLKALAERYSSPETASRPFDRRRCGFVMSEGAGALVLEERDHARARGATVLGEILGVGDSADAYRITDTRPDGVGAVLAMSAALADAGLTAADVDAVNAHATSTVLGDAAEARAIKDVLGERAASVPVSANKSSLGHTIAAAGAIESILALEGMRRSLLLPTLNREYPDPRCDLDVVPLHARPFEHRVTLSNSFGFGGQNACLCLGRGDA
jgi:3-oxoacyl-[acyl-carrier-protein] synthase II